jgi:hypothetical protein
MDLIVIGQRSVLENAISAATPRRDAQQLEGLNSLLDAIPFGILSEIWEEVVNGVRKGFELGVERARPIYDQTIQSCEQLLQSAGAAAVQIVAELKARLQRLVQDYIDGTLTTVRATLSVGSKQLELLAVDVQHKIILGGDISLSLQQVFKLIASGELSIAAKYGTPGS